MELLIKRLQDFCWQLSPHLSNFRLICAILHLLVLELIVESIQILLQVLDLVLLICKLVFEAFLFSLLVDLCLSQLLLKSFKVSLRIQGAIRMHESLFRVCLNFTCTFTLFLFD